MDTSKEHVVGSPATLAVRFRQAMATLCTPVTVVTGMDGDRPHGTTVSAFGSLPMDPTMVTVALDRGSALLAMVRRTRRFGVNVLGSDQSDLALRFARKGTDKFVGVEWHAAEGLPRLTGTQTWLSCDAAELVDGGDHVIALGLVTEIDTVPTSPLTYCARSFGTHLDHEHD
ncbi:flavin reductase family protein [Amycolatopsis sp. H20-H5]|uniref:flavin reductase family protein n=1 Tax=Amycolatopsis sp. H20-H5 TaxID=3046309 RepID=UPI002DB9A82E|nr:flavin reductase family protein [Amycolatopsis sp. H20-H5]MEC3974493.1 flavin reductase family protein [Amycolatopsis sp. H20-H5]